MTRARAQVRQTVKAKGVSVRQDTGGYRIRLNYNEHKFTYQKQTTNIKLTT